MLGEGFNSSLLLLFVLVLLSLCPFPSAFSRHRRASKTLRVNEKAKVNRDPPYLSKGLWNLV